MMVYSANNLPYSALSGVMTGDLGERTSLSSYRFVCAMLAQLVIQGLALPMVHHFGQGNNAKGYQITMGIFSALAVVLFLITFATTRERIQPPPGQKASVRQHFADLLKNGPVAGHVRPDAGAVHHALDARQRRPLLLQLLRGQGEPRQAARRRWARAERRSDEGRIVSLGFSVFNVLGHRGDDRRRSSSPRRLAIRFGKRNVFIAGLGGDGAVHRGLRLPAADGGRRDVRVPRSSASSPTASPSRCCGR